MDFNPECVCNSFAFIPQANTAYDVMKEISILSKSIINSIKSRFVETPDQTLADKRNEITPEIIIPPAKPTSQVVSLQAAETSVQKPTESKNKLPNKNIAMRKISSSYFRTTPQNAEIPAQKLSDKKKSSKKIIRFSVYIVTWNVGSKYPEKITIHNLLGLENSPENDTHLPDFYVIGLQEVNAQVQNVVMGMFKEDPWTQKFKEILKIRKYVLVKTEQMQGLLIMLFARNTHILHLREIETEYTRTGIAGIWGNKGAVSIRLNIYGCSVVFLNAHLAAHDHMLEERIDDYNKIIEEHKYHVKVTQNILSHDYVFWFGDLNFRLMGEATTSPEDIREMVKNDKLIDLMERDQLRLVMKKNNAFHELIERPPAFPPTFKFEIGTNEYDMKRRPAWCDRVLYKCTENNYKNVKLVAQQTSYKSHPIFTLSDHKPVTSEFTIKVVKKPYTPKPDRVPTKRVIDFVDGQVFSDPSEMLVEFSPFNEWPVGEEFTIQYILPEGMTDAGSDWIGIYKEDFASLDEYEAYEYTLRNEEIENASVSGKLFSLTFPNTIQLSDGGQQYVLLYFQSTGTRGVTGLAGISEPFTVNRSSNANPLDLFVD